MEPESKKRRIDRIWVLTLFGKEAEEFETVDDALAYVARQPEEGSGQLVRIELQVHYVNGPQIDGISLQERRDRFPKEQKKRIVLNVIFGPLRHVLVLLPQATGSADADAVCPSCVLQRPSEVRWYHAAGQETRMLL